MDLEIPAFKPPILERFESWLGLHQQHALTRFVLLRLLGLVYTAAFASLVWQVVPLVGEHGITPASHYLADSLRMAGSRSKALLAEPSLFFFVGITPAGQDLATVSSNHSPRFYMDEQALDTGARAMLAVALDYLAGKPTDGKPTAP